MRPNCRAVSYFILAFFQNFDSPVSYFFLNFVCSIHFFFVRDAFIRDEMMSTENFGKIRDGEYSNFSRYKG